MAWRDHHYCDGCTKYHSRIIKKKKVNCWRIFALTNFLNSNQLIKYENLFLKDLLAETWILSALNDEKWHLNYISIWPTPAQKQKTKLLSFTSNQPLLSVQSRWMVSLLMKIYTLKVYWVTFSLQTSNGTQIYTILCYKCGEKDIGSFLLHQKNT